MVAFLGLLSGYAKGTSEEIDRRREEERQYLRDRMKMAAENRQRYLDQINDEKSKVSKVWESLQPYTSNMSEQQKIGLLSSPELAKQFYNKVAVENQSVDIDKFMVLNADQIPSHITSVQDYINSIGAPTKPDAGKQMLAGLSQQQETFRGAKISSGEKDFQREAARYGATAEDLLQHESPKPTPSLGRQSYAALKPGALTPEMTLDEKEAKLEAEVVNLMDQGKADEAETAKARLQSFREYRQAVSPEAQKFQTLVDQGMIALHLARQSNDPEKIKAAEKNLMSLRQVAEFGKPKEKSGEGYKPPTRSDLRSGVKNAINNAILKQFGDRLNEGFTLQQDAFGGVSEWVHNGKDEKTRKEVQALRERVAKSFLRFYSGTGVGDEVLREFTTSDEDSVTSDAIKQEAKKRIAEPGNTMTEDQHYQAIKDDLAARGIVVK